MIKFKGGSAEGQVLMLKRKPLFLRVVFNGKKYDALDQLEDTPRDDEKIFAYKLITKDTPGDSSYVANGLVHVNYGGGRGGWYAVGDYQFVEEQPTDEEMRFHWIRWCAEQVKNVTVALGKILY